MKGKKHPLLDKAKLYGDSFTYGMIIKDLEENFIDKQELRDFIGEMKKFDEINGQYYYSPAFDLMLKELRL